MVASLKMSTYANMHEKKRVEKPRIVAAPKPTVAGLKMLTYAQMRKHQHIENPPCACRDIESVLAKVPEDQQSQFVRVLPRSQPRYANFPTGVSIFREELDLDMTGPPRNSTDQPRPSLDSMVMAPGMTEKYIGSRGGADQQKRDNGQMCMPQVATVVSHFFNRALKAVQHRSKMPSPPVESPIEKEFLPNPPDDVVSDTVAMPQPCPPNTTPLQRSNAIRYRIHPRPQPQARQDSIIGHHPGGEANSYYLSEATRESEALCEQPIQHPLHWDSPVPKPQQRTHSAFKGSTYSHVQRYEIPLVGRPQSPNYIDKTMDEPRPPPLHGTNDLPSMADMPGLPPPIQCDGYLLWPNLGTMEMPPDFASASSSSGHQTYTGIEDDLASPSSDYSTYAATKVGVPDDVSGGIPEAIRASRRFSLDETSLEEAVPAGTRFSMSSISDGVPEAIRAENRSPINSGSWVDSSPHENDTGYYGDAEFELGGDDHSLSSDSSDGKIPAIRGASLCGSSVGSFPARASSLGYYRYAAASVPLYPYSQHDNSALDRYLANDMDLYAEPDSYLHQAEQVPTRAYSSDDGDDDGSIDQSLFAEFDGDHTGTPSLTNETSLSDSSKNASDKGRAANTANHASTSICKSTPDKHRISSLDDVHPRHVDEGHDIDSEYCADDEGVGERGAGRLLKYDWGKTGRTH